MAKKAKKDRPCFSAQAVVDFCRVVSEDLLQGLDESDFCCLGTLRDVAKRRAEQRVQSLVERLRAAGEDVS